ncbi:MAG: hypothetical protein FJW56_04350, partial [Actinobacteria bacterium]|nr:hypothetical protein [Actinomycetota bacterium]
METGTFHGDTVEKVRELFEEIHSVELSREYFSECKQRFKDNKNVLLYLDSSENFLKELRPKVKDESVMYWLDAHWCVADKTAGEKSQCPLLEEINSIKSLNEKSVIAIDDARLFTSPPPSPHEISHWPDFESVTNSLHKLSDKHSIIIFNDIILFFPNSIKDEINEYAYLNTFDLLNLYHKQRDYDNLKIQFDGLLNQLQAKEEAIVGLSDDLKEKEEKIVSLSDDLKEKEEKIVSLSDDLKAKEEAIVSLSDDLKAKEEAIVSLSDDLKEKEEKIVGLSDDLKAKEEAIVSLSDDLKEKEEKIVSLSDDLKAKEEAIVSLSDDLKEKEEKIFSLSDDLKEKEEKIVSLSDDLKAKEEAIVSL